MRLMQLDSHGSDDAEVAAAAPYCPEQLGLLIRPDGHAMHACHHHFDAKQVVCCQAVQTVNRAIAAAQGQAGDADLTAVAQRRNQPLGAGGGSYVLEPCTTLDDCGP